MSYSKVPQRKLRLSNLLAIFLKVSHLGLFILVLLSFLTIQPIQTKIHAQDAPDYSEKLQKPSWVDQPQQLASPPHGDWKILALLVDFPDQPAQVNASEFDNLLFGGQFNTLTHYYNTVSYGQLNLNTINMPSNINWLRMPQTFAYYANGQDKGLGPYPQNAQKMAEDAVAAADQYVDFSQYDNDGDGKVDTVIIIHSGRANGSLPYIISHAGETYIDPVVDGVTVNSFITGPEYWGSPGDITLGVYAHELGHAFGLPDLYDRVGVGQGVGEYSVMSSVSQTGDPILDTPKFPDAWSRMKLGFVTPINVTGISTGSIINEAELSSSVDTVYRLWTNGSSGSEYFLVENRQKTGYDSNLHGSGLLIWHIDENQPDNNTECAQVNNWLCGSPHYKVALEQADGLFDLERTNIVGGDTGDPFPGSTNNRNFNFTSTPNSSSYASNTDTFVGVTNISDSGSVMTADLAVVEPLPDLIVERVTYNPTNPIAGQQVNITVSIKNIGNATAASSSGQPFAVELFIDSERPSGCGDNFVPIGWIDSLAPGESRDISTSHVFTTEGSHFSWAYVDTDCIIRESSDFFNFKGPEFITVFPSPTPTPDDLIFANSFEEDDCSLSPWTSCATDGGDLSFNSPSLLSTGSQSLNALIDSNTPPIYALYTNPSAESRYRARFYFKRGTVTMTNSDIHNIFEGYTETSKLALRVQLRRSSGNYQLRAALLNDGTTWKSTSWYNLSASGEEIQFFELDWRAATGVGKNDGGLTLWINDIQNANLTGVDNDMRRIKQIRLGAIGIDNGTRGTYYFDAFESRRLNKIGPAEGLPSPTPTPLVSPTPTLPAIPTPTPTGLTPTPTPTPSTIPTSPTPTPTPSSSCVLGSASWQNESFTTQTGTFTAKFDVTPSSNNVDQGDVGLSNGAAASATALAASVRFNSSGAIRAYNGAVGSYAGSIPYSANVTYLIRMAVDLATDTYSVYVTPKDGAEQTLASGFALRFAATQLNNKAIKQASTTTGTINVCNFSITP